VKRRATLVLSLLLVGCWGGCGPTPPEPGAGLAGEVDPRVHAFYYGWYDNVATGAAYRHWNHQVYQDDTPPFPGGDDIGANFFPALGCYSSQDPRTLRTHMQQLRQARVGTICLSWWGPGSYEDRAAWGILEAARPAGIRVCFHLEPFEGRSPETCRAAIVYIQDRYGEHPAFHRDPTRDDRTIFYVYDSYHIPPDQWARLLSPEGDLTIRDTPHDADVIGLWVEEEDAERLAAAHFDGAYTYFAVDGFTHGSTTGNWRAVSAWARQHGKLFIPCVGPGYDDTRIRPWNARNRRGREGGAYYDRMWQAALRADSPLVGITSFNEWHEGTQIEPAVPKEIEGFRYEDYAPLEGSAYLLRTRQWVERFRARSPGGR
jgi:hypothetical protein